MLKDEKKDSNLGKNTKFERQLKKKSFMSKFAEYKFDDLVSLKNHRLIDINLQVKYIMKIKEDNKKIEYLQKIIDGYQICKYISDQKSRFSEIISKLQLNRTNILTNSFLKIINDAIEFILSIKMIFKRQMSNINQKLSHFYIKLFDVGESILNRYIRSKFGTNNLNEMKNGDHKNGNFSTKNQFSMLINDFEEPNFDGSIMKLKILLEKTRKNINHSLKKFNKNIFTKLDDYNSQLTNEIVKLNTNYTINDFIILPISNPIVKQFLGF